MIEENNSLAIEKLKRQVVCPVELALRVIGGKWRGSILYQLKDGALRFNELRNRVQEAVVDYEEEDNYLSNKVLSNHLKDLTDFGVVRKEEIAPNKVKYELTSKGVLVIPTLIELFDWGEKLF
jgi:DNA-binding HxlR family transcriptional regulator